MGLLIPRHSYEDLRRLADEFRLRYDREGIVPVPIEQIIEFGLDIDIVPIPSLRRAFDIDGFVSADIASIYVDEAVFSNQPSRYRFTLAHEVAHAYLHRDIIAYLRPQSLREWKEIMPGLTEEERGWLEYYQASSFAGLLLVPRDPLIKAFRETTQIAEQAGLRIDRVGEVLLPYVSEKVSKEFEVSPEVIRRRIEKEGLWPPQ